MVLSCNNGKQIMITNMITTSSTHFFFFFFDDNVMKHLIYITNPYLNSQDGNSQIMTQRNIQRRIERPAKHVKAMN